MGVCQVIPDWPVYGVFRARLRRVPQWGNVVPNATEAQEGDRQEDDVDA